MLAVDALDRCNYVRNFSFATSPGFRTRDVARVDNETSLKSGSILGLETDIKLRIKVAFIVDILFGIWEISQSLEKKVENKSQMFTIE